jgi:hypothetical protein
MDSNAQRKATSGEVANQDNAQADYISVPASQAPRLKNIFQVEYQSMAVMFTETGWFNATVVAEQFDKRPVDWLSQDGTKEYIFELALILKCEPKSLSKTKRGNNGGTWLHPRLGVLFARWLDVRFGVWCDDQIYRILSGNHPHYDWKKLRHEATASYKVMGQILQLTRQRLGKTCAPHHFINEARIINCALTGQSGKVDREGLNTGELDLLARLENLDAVLLACGSSYEERKQELAQFASDQRNPQRLAVEVEHDPQP